MCLNLYAFVIKRELYVCWWQWKCRCYVVKSAMFVVGVKRCQLDYDNVALIVYRK